MLATASPHVGTEAKNIFQTHKDKCIFLEELNETLNKHSLVCYASCLMDYHLVNIYLSEGCSRFRREISENKGLHKMIKKLRIYCDYASIVKTRSRNPFLDHSAKEPPRFALPHADPLRNCAGERLSGKSGISILGGVYNDLRR